MASGLWRTLTRKKVISQIEISSLGRVLNVVDLTFLGIGATLGVGLYVLVGKVAKEIAGPSIILSFLIAAIASGFAALCYAEFGARVPRAGSAYIYSYVCVGEFIAFIIGWNLILEYIIGSASVAHGMTLYIDSLANNTLKNAFTEIAPIHVKFFAQYFDFFAFGASILLSIFLAIGLKESTLLNNIVTVLNLGVVLFVIIAGSTKADIKNWKLAPLDRKDDMGGFFPFGINGMIKGAATCFYGFVGFDCIATTGEEAKNPQRAIPMAIIISLTVCFFAYFGVSTVITLMIPYWAQDVNAPIPSAFDDYNMDVGKWIVSVGGCFALCASLFGAMFPLPRIIYAMANDGVIFRILGRVNKRFSTPLIGTLVAGVLTGIISGIFEQAQLVDMMSIGTLLAYTIVATSVLRLRYSFSSTADKFNSITEVYSEEFINENLKTEEIETTFEIENVKPKLGWLGYLFNINNHKHPTKATENLVHIEVTVYCVLCIVLSLLLKLLEEHLSRRALFAIILTSILGLIILLIIISMAAQPQAKTNLTFKVPLVPLIPALSILVNIYLMMSLDIATWIRFAAWMSIGLPIYIYSTIDSCCKSDNNFNTQSLENNDNLNDESTYVNLSYLNDELEQIASKSDKEIAFEGEGSRKLKSNSNKGSADSDSGAFFDENENNEIEQSEVELESARNVLVAFDTMLDKEEEKCGECATMGLVRRTRSVSLVSSVSNNSNSLPQEESVVAIIHREAEPEVILEQPEIENEKAIEAEILNNRLMQNNESKKADIVPVEVANNGIIVVEVNLTKEISEPILELQTSKSPETREINSLEILDNNDKDTLINDSESKINKILNTEENSPEEVKVIDTTKDVEQGVKLEVKLENNKLVAVKDDKPEAQDIVTEIKENEIPVAVIGPPPPPPPSMTQFETYKALRQSPSDLHVARGTLKKRFIPETPPSSPVSIRSRRVSENLPEDNLKPTSEAGKLFRNKLEMNLGHAPKNLKFSILPAPNYSIDNPKVGKLTTPSSSNSNVPINTDPTSNEKEDGVIDESINSIDKATIKERLTQLFAHRKNEPPGTRKTKLHVKSNDNDVETKDEEIGFGETKA